MVLGCRSRERRKDGVGEIADRLVAPVVLRSALDRTEVLSLLEPGHLASLLVLLVPRNGAGVKRVLARVADKRDIDRRPEQPVQDVQVESDEILHLVYEDVRIDGFE